MIRDPRAVFDQLFGVGATPEARARRRQKDKSLLDWVMASAAELKAGVGAGDRARLDDYLDNVREIERRIQKVEAHNASGEARELPTAPIGVPDSYADHVRLMFDLQALAFAADITRVFAFKLSRDVSNRVFSEAGATTGFHIASHHNEREDRITDFAKINRYHVEPDSVLPREAEADCPTSDGTVLDNSLIVYGSPMGNPNVHNHKRCPLFFAGHAGGRLKGNMHIKAPDGTPMANAMLAGLQGVGVGIDTFGDSTSAARPERGDDMKKTLVAVLMVLVAARRLASVPPLAPDGRGARSRPRRCGRMRRRCARWSRTARTSTPRRATA